MSAVLPDPGPPVSAVPETAADMPRVELKTVFLGGIFLLLLFASLRAASEIALPIVLALVLKLVLQPLLRALEQSGMPRKIASFFILMLLISGLVALGTALSVPITSWTEKLPSNIEQLQEHLSFLRRPVEKTQKMLVQAEDMTKVAGPKVMPVAIQGTRLSDRVFIGTQAFASGLFTMIIVLFFLLAAGDTFLRRMVEVVPRFKNKRQVVDISQQIEHDISVYLLTITLMNLLVGIATGIMMWACGVADPMLWGTIAFLLNYVPIVGPWVGGVIFLFVGLLANIDGAALIPVCLYLLIHVIESSLITPLLLAKRFTLNPVLVVVALVFWYWMWGVPGAILAVPMLAITKIICDRIEPLSAFGHFLEG